MNKLPYWLFYCFWSGLSIHTFHGNFFVRSTDLVSLPNVSPDSGFSMQIDIEDSLTDSNLAVFQSALLYTSTKGNVRFTAIDALISQINHWKPAFSEVERKVQSSFLFALQRLWTFFKFELRSIIFPSYCLLRFFVRHCKCVRLRYLYSGTPLYGHSYITDNFVCPDENLVYFLKN